MPGTAPGQENFCIVKARQRIRCLSRWSFIFCVFTAGKHIQIGLVAQVECIKVGQLLIPRSFSVRSFSKKAFTFRIWLVAFLYK